MFVLEGNIWDNGCIFLALSDLCKNFHDIRGIYYFDMQKTKYLSFVMLLTCFQDFLHKIWAFIHSHHDIKIKHSKEEIA